MILENLAQKNIILGSGSPRRKQLLEGLGIPFSVQTKDTIETYDSALTREEVPRFLAELKASAFEGVLKENDLLLTSDTTVWVENEILHKPKNEAEAKNMLEQLSGITHSVITGVCIMDTSKKVTFHDETLVTFGEITPQEITYYVENFKPYDKAGSYGAQEFMGYVAIQKLEGSYFNVMGLPVHKVFSELKKW